MRAILTIIFIVFCISAQAEVPAGSGYIYVDEEMPGDLYDTLLDKIKAQAHLSIADDCNTAGAVLIYRPDSSQPLQIIDKSGNKLNWKFKLSTKHLARSARSAMSDLDREVSAAVQKMFSDTIESVLNGGGSIDDRFNRIYTRQWEYWKIIDSMTDEVSDSIRQLEYANGTTLMFGPNRGLLSFVDSTFYRPDPDGDKIELRVGKAPHFLLVAEHSDTSITFDLPDGLIGQLGQLGEEGVILVRWKGYFSVPEDLQTSSDADPKTFNRTLRETTSVFRAKNLRAALNSLLTGSCMYNYDDAITD